MKKAFETITQFILIAFLFGLVQLAVLGVTLDFSRVATWEFWVEVLGQFALTMTTFNVIYYLHRSKKTHDTGSRFYVAWQTNKLRVRQIEEQKLYDELDKAVENENLNRLKEKCNRKICKLCSRISYDEVITDKPIDELFEEYRVITKNLRKVAKFFERVRAHRLRKLIEKIRAGKIKVRKINAKIFLTDRELSSNKYDNYDINNALSEIKRNTDKAVAFFLCAILLAVVGFSFVLPYWWLALLKNITFVLSGIVSGISSAHKNVKMRTSIYENRNRFFSKNLNITVEYVSKEQEN